MKKKILMFILTFIMVIPCAIFLSACCGDDPNSQTQEIGINVYIDGVQVTENYNTVEIEYGQYDTQSEIIDRFISVTLNYNNNTSKNLEYGNSGYSITGFPEVFNVNEQGYNLTISYKEYSQNIKLIINKKELDFSNVYWNYFSPYTYDREKKVVELVNVPEEVNIIYENNTAVNAGNYTAKAKLDYNQENYEIINDNVDLSQDWTIKKATIDMFFVSWSYKTQQFIYDGSEKRVELINIPNGVNVNYTGNTAIKAGLYTAEVELIYDNLNYELINVNFDYLLSWTINKQQVVKPKIESYNLYYTGKKQTKLNYNDSEEGILFNIEGTKNAINAGEYSTTFKLLDKNNFEWSDGTSDDIILKWTIQKAQLTGSSARWNYDSSFVYDGDEKSVSIINLPEGLSVKNYIGTVTATDAGTYTADVIYDYDDVNYYLEYAPEDLTWVIEKAENSITGNLLMPDKYYGEELEQPSGLTASYGEITYKFYTKDENNEYIEFSGIPTNVGNYFVCGLSVSDKNWISMQSDFVEFEILRVYLKNPELGKSSFVYSGEEFTPATKEEINNQLIDVAGNLSATEVGNYKIVFSLKDKKNYGWVNAFETQQYADDIELEWSIIDSPISLTINDIQIDSKQIESLNQLNIGDEWSFEILDDNYRGSVIIKYLDRQTGEIVESSTSDKMFNVTSSYYFYTINIYLQGVEVYTKTINVNHNIIEKVTIGSEEISFDEFIENPVVDYGKQVSFTISSNYQDKFTISPKDFVVTNDQYVYIYCDYLLEQGITYKEIHIICNTEILTDIYINDKKVSFLEFKNMNFILFNSTLRFKVNEQFSELYSVYTRDDYSSSEIQQTGEFSYTFNNIQKILQIIIKTVDGYNYCYIDIRPILFENIVINNQNFDLYGLESFGNLNYEKDMNEDEFTIEFDENTINKYDLYYYTSVKDGYIKIDQPVLNLSIDEIGLSITVVYRVPEDGYNCSILSINFLRFNPINTISVTIKQQGSQETRNFNKNNTLQLEYLSGVITNFEVKFEDKYKDCQYKIFNPDGIEINDFSNIENGVYQLKVYLDGSEIFSQDFKIEYRLTFLMENLNYISSSGDLALITNENILSKEYIDTSNFKSQSIIFNGNDSIQLNEGQNIINAVYSVTVDSVKYTYEFKLYVEYISDEDLPGKYVNSITIKFIDTYDYSSTITINNVNDNIQDTISLYSLARVTSDDIAIYVNEGVTVLSKEIIIENNNLAYIQYKLETEDGQKIYRIYFTNIYDKISNNINAEFILSDQVPPEKNITDQLEDNLYVIENLNLYGNFEIIPEDEYIQVKVYFEDELIENRNSKNVSLEKVGTYVIEIISSDNTVTRTITIIVEKIESLIFEVFYNDTKLYLQTNGDQVDGNVKIALIDNEPMYLGYFGEVDLGDEEYVTLSGRTMYEDNLFDENMNPITDLTNIVLKLQVDLDGSITGVENAKYVLIYIQADTYFYVPVSFVFAEEPPYPMIFVLDTNNNGEVDENDVKLDLKINVSEVLAGIVDLGDFVKDSRGALVKLTREQLGLEEGENTINVIVVWQSTFNDLRYQYTTEEFTYEETPELTGPSEGNLTSTFTLTFEEQTSGEVSASIHVSGEGSNAENLRNNLIEVIFVLDK